MQSAAIRDLVALLLGLRLADMSIGEHANIPAKYPVWPLLYPGEYPIISGLECERMGMRGTTLGRQTPDFQAVSALESIMWENLLADRASAEEKGQAIDVVCLSKSLLETLPGIIPGSLAQAPRHG